MVLIRLALLQDSAGIGELIAMLFPESGGLFSPTDKIWVAEEEGELIGFVRFTQENERWMLNGWGVLPEVRSRGIGTELLRRALKAFKDAPVRLEVEACNPAVELYSRFGFTLQKFGSVHMLVRKPET
ncbi:MAG TPA: GNAT family N-acetyltransferase [Candidatus Bilamarchaeaceae archaeon]|nr:GNAT family N-acetyltransferase [Candidatus Bilamarchaeaceae archaeon]